MLTKYKIPCEHCGKINEAEVDQNIHQVNNSLAKNHNEINEVKRMVRNVLEIQDSIFKEILEQNNLIKEYHKDPKVFDKIKESVQQFEVRCTNCNFKKRGSLNEVYTYQNCPNCKKIVELCSVTPAPEGYPV